MASREENAETEADCNDDEKQARACHCRPNAASVSEEPGEGEKCGEDQVELLLDRQRPCVQQGIRRRIDTEVSATAARTCEVRIRIDQTRGDACTSSRGLCAEGRKEDAQNHRARQRHGEGREDSTYAAQIEGSEIETAHVTGLAQQHARDDEAGNHKERIDANETAVENKSRVIGDDDCNGNGAQALNVGAKIRCGGRGEAGGHVGSFGGEVRVKSTPQSRNERPASAAFDASKLTPLRTSAGVEAVRNRTW